MTPEAATAATLAGMAAVTYGSRAAGLAIVSRLNVAGRLKAFLEAIPGAILAALIAPAALGSGLPEILATTATAALAWRTKNLPLAMAAGVAVTFAARLALR